MSLLLGFFLMVSAADSNLAYKIGTVAGSDWAPDNSPAIAAILVQTEGIAEDTSGNLYVSDAASHRVYKVSRAGIISIVAGTGYPGFGGDGGKAVTAQLNSPYGLGFDGIGNLYIADLGNARIRRISPDGMMTTVVGGGSLPAGGVNDGIQANEVALSAPRNLAWDGHGLLYISDFTAHRVYQFAPPNGSLTTIAGTGSAGFSGDNGPAGSAQLAYPTAVAVDRQGSLLIADSQNHLIRKVSNGMISSVARAATPTGLTFDSFGTLYVADPGAGQILTIPVTGTPAVFQILAHDLTVGPDGYVYAANGTEILRVAFFGANVVVAGGGSAASGDGGPAQFARLNHPAGVAVDAQGNLYIADRDNHRVRRVTPDGNVATVAGTGSPGYSGDGGPALQAQLNAPESVTVDSQGNLYIADTGNHRVRVVGPNGIIWAMIAGLSSPGYTVPDRQGNFYMTDTDAGTIVMMNSSGASSAVLTDLQSPYGLALDGNGNLYFTEASGPHVRRLGRDGSLTSLGEGIWRAPQGISLDSSGNLFVADSGLQQILEISSSGQIFAIAGTGTAGLSGDGGDALSAQLGYPSGVCTGLGGTLYIADSGNNRIRQLNPQTTSLSAPLVLVSAVNAATLQPGPVAPGMLLDLLGTGLAASDAPNVQVMFDTIAAPVLTLDTSRLVVQVPPQVAGQQSANIQIVNQGKLLAQIPVGIAATAPGIFTTAAGQAAANNADGSVNSPTNPAPRGSVIALYGTGEGVSGLPAIVSIGGYAAEVLYQGEVAGYPGLLQINARVPAGYVPPGNLSVVVTIGQASSQTGVTVAVN